MCRNKNLICVLGMHIMTRSYGSLSLEDIYKVIKFDLLHTYTTPGVGLFKQIRGAPIGGFLSPNYANIKCAYDEYIFCRNIKRDRCLNNVTFKAIRQVDDLIAWAAYDVRDPTSKVNAKKLLQNLTSEKTYTGGLTLKIQETVYEKRENGF